MNRIDEGMRINAFLESHGLNRKETVVFGIVITVGFLLIFLTCVGAVTVCGWFS